MVPGIAKRRWREFVLKLETYMEESRTNQEWLEYWLHQFNTAKNKLAEAVAASYNGDDVDVAEMKRAQTMIHVANQEIRRLQEEIAREDEIKNEQQTK